MKNIPIFDTENGVGSLIIKDVPYTQTAYIKIESASDPVKFVDECISFCRVVGAEKIFATGHEALKKYPYHTAIIRMVCPRDIIEDTDVSIFPVTEKTVDRWLEIYRAKMMSVPNAAYMTHSDGDEMLARGDGYFIHRDGDLMGIGMASGETIDLIASLKPGAGKEIVRALNHALSGDRIVLDVASANEKAVKLYESLGFLKTEERAKWYKIF